METLDERRRHACFVNVTVPASGWGDGDRITVYRFPNDETGHARAVRYRNAYNKSLREAIGVTDADLELSQPDYSQRPGEYDRALMAEQYRDHVATLDYPQEPRLIGNGDPLPTDYPHGF